MSNSAKVLMVTLLIMMVVAIALSGALWYRLQGTEAGMAMVRVQLEGINNELSNTRTKLMATEYQLNSTKTQLSDTEARLKNATVEFQVTTNQLNNTKSQLESVSQDLNTSQSKLVAAEEKLSAAENKRTQMLSQYAQFRQQINQRLGQQLDSRSYITPNDPSVASKVTEITGGYSNDQNERWLDYERLFRWVNQNIRYATDSYTPILPEAMDGALTWKPEFWRMPAETLKDSVGDCEDAAALLASMLLNYNKGSHAVWGLGIAGRSVEGHMAVAMPVSGGRLTIIDPTGNFYTGYGYAPGLTSEDVSVAVSNWLKHWNAKLPGATIYMALSDKFYREFTTTAEFIEWARSFK